MVVQDSSAGFFFPAVLRLSCSRHRFEFLVCVSPAFRFVLAGWQQQQQQQRRQRLPQQLGKKEAKNSRKSRPNGRTPRGHYRPAQPCRISQSRRLTSSRGSCLGDARRRPPESGCSELKRSETSPLCRERSGALKTQAARNCRACRLLLQTRTREHLAPSTH